MLVLRENGIREILRQIDFAHPDIDDIVVDYEKPVPMTLLTKFEADEKELHIAVGKMYIYTARRIDNIVRVYDKTNGSFLRQIKKKTITFAGLATDEQYLYVTNQGENNVLVLRQTDDSVVHAIGHGLHLPGRIAVDDEFLYVIDTNSRTSFDIVTFRKNGNFVRRTPCFGYERTFTSIAVDSQFLYMSVADYNCFCVFDKVTNVGIFGTSKSGLERRQTNNFTSVAANDKHIYLSESGNHAVKVYRKEDNICIAQHKFGEFGAIGDETYVKLLAVDDRCVYVTGNKGIQVLACVT